MDPRLCLAIGGIWILVPFHTWLMPVYKVSFLHEVSAEHHIPRFHARSAFSTATFRGSQWRKVSRASLAGGQGHSGRGSNKGPFCWLTLTLSDTQISITNHWFSSRLQFCPKQSAIWEGDKSLILMHAHLYAFILNEAKHCLLCIIQEMFPFYWRTAASTSSNSEQGEILHLHLLECYMLHATMYPCSYMLK